MRRTERAQKAQETLDIVEAGYYQAGGQNVSISDSVNRSVSNTLLYRSDDFEAVLQSAASKAQQHAHATEIIVRNCTVLEGATALIAGGEKIGCLNFASAKNPGGGFLGGAQAQEESLALSSALYRTLTEKFEMYRYNRSRSTLLYSDYMIYSPDVVFFRNDEGELLERPYEVSVITSPAVNVGAIRANSPHELALTEEAMLRWMDKVLALFVHHGLENLLLGAWGCGVFQNDPNNIARYFKSFLTGDGKYASCFKKVFFAVYDRSKEGENISAFQEAFAGCDVTIDTEV